MTTSIFGKNTTSSDEYTVDYSLLDADVASTLAGMESCEVDDDAEEDGDTDVGSALVDVDVEVDNGTGYTKLKVTKVIINQSASTYVMLDGKGKIQAMNLPAVRNRKNGRLAREQIAIRDMIYNNIINVDNINMCDVIIKELKESEDNIFWMMG